MSSDFYTDDESADPTYTVPPMPRKRLLDLTQDDESPLEENRIAGEEVKSDTAKSVLFPKFFVLNEVS